MSVRYVVWRGDAPRDRDLYYGAERDLRRSRLRAHLGPDADLELFPGEDTARTVHVSAVLDRFGLVGCALFRLDAPDRGRLFQMAVQDQYAGRGIGRGLARTLQRYVEAHVRAPVRIEVHARDGAVGFYRKLGYDLVPGSGPFIEVGLPHRLLFKVVAPAPGASTPPDADVSQHGDVLDLSQLQSAVDLPETEDRSAAGDEKP